MKTILVVDDSMMTRMILTTIIKEHYPSWEIVQAKDADDALEKVVDLDFDFATIDMNMPGKTGLELIPLLQKSHPKAVIALLTANIQKKVSDRAEELGVELLSKPVNETIILKFLEQ
jgi:CheY-like chemotaxis protein